MEPIYLDNNATTRVDPAVVEAMLPFFTEHFGNASSMHAFGSQVGKALKNARLLSLEAPRLPVVGCTNPGGCHCRFQHHDDRRAGPRRTGLGKSTQGTWSADDNRRHSAGRRDSDYADGAVQTLLVDGEAVYVGGDFTGIGGQARARLAVIRVSDGQAY